MNSILTQHCPVFDRKISINPVSGRILIVTLIVLTTASGLFYGGLSSANRKSFSAFKESAFTSEITRDVFYRGYRIEGIGTGYIAAELGVAAADLNVLCTTINTLLYRASTGTVNPAAEKAYQKADRNGDLELTRDEILLFSRMAAKDKRETETNRLIKFWGISG